jgi:hypothetical protein
MPLQYSLNIEQAAKFPPAANGPVGYLPSASFFGTSLHADINFSAAPSGVTMPVASVLSSVAWAGTPTATLHVAGYISPGNWELLTSEVEATLKNVAVSFAVVVYAYDAWSAEYFCAFAPEVSPITTTLARDGGSVGISLSEEPVTVAGVTLYEFTIVAAAPQTAQAFMVAAGPEQQTAKPWGVLATQ